MAYDDEGDNDDKVGYRNPPKATRFKPGQSGNPKGRPKGAPGLPAIVRKVLSEKITVTENGRRQKKSKEELIVRVQVNKSLQGDPRACKFVMSLRPADPEPPYDPGGDEDLINAKEKLRVLLERHIEHQNLEIPKPGSSSEDEEDYDPPAFPHLFKRRPQNE